MHYEMTCPKPSDIHYIYLQYIPWNIPDVLLHSWYKDVVETSVTKISLRITYLKYPNEHPGASELNPWYIGHWIHYLKIYGQQF